MKIRMKMLGVVGGYLLALGVLWLFLLHVGTSPSGLSGASLSWIAGITEARAESTFEKESKANKVACEKWCSEHEACRKCDTNAACGMGFTAVKTFGGRGKNWHACEETDFKKHSEENEAECEAFCAGNVDCIFCSEKPGGGIGYKHLKTFGGKGKNWYAVEHRDGILGRLAVSEEDRCCGLVEKPIDCSNKFWTGFLSGSLVERWNRIFHDACVRHDYCYIYGKLTYGKTQADCDNALYKDIKQICLHDFPQVAQPNCFKNAELYYLGVRKFGSQYFATDGDLICNYPDRMTSREERKKSISACTSYGWRPASGGNIPARALKGGHEPGSDLYICRAMYQGGLHPGKLIGPACNIGYGGKEVRISEYDVLVVPPAAKLKWVPASHGQIPAGAIKGGHEPGSDLYICRAMYQGGLHPGKLIGPACNIGYGGKEVRISEYEVPVL